MRQVSAALTAVEPSLGEEFFGLVEGVGVSVACEQVHDDERVLGNGMAHVVGAVESLARESKTNGCVNTRSFLDYRQTLWYGMVQK